MVMAVPVMATTTTWGTIRRAAARRSAAASAAIAAHAAATAAAAAVAVTGQNLVVAPHQGDSDHREEDRDAEDQCTIHS